jgi:hypothetical protein
VELLLLSASLVLSAIIAFGICRVLLGGLFALMSGTTLPFVFHWKRVVFASALFWFWYLTPVLAANGTAARILRLLASR